MVDPLARQKEPFSVTLEDGRTVRVRGILASDGPALEEFYGSVPPEELRDLDCNPRKLGVIRDWLEEGASPETLHLVAEGDEGCLVGHCLVQHPPRGWKAHQGTIRVVVRPGWRWQGLAGALIERMILLSLHAGLDLLVAELTPGQVAARSAFSRQGFHPRATLARFVRDAEGRDLDLLVLAREIREQEYFAAD
jgi:GNAT superfamily N-acetyltransferase